MHFRNVAGGRSSTKTVLWLAVVVSALVFATPAAAEDRAAARRAFIDGSKYYDLNQYAEALDAFKRAYWNYEDAAILYNIAQCQRALKHTSEAISFYRGYLRKAPSAPNRNEVQQIISELESALVHERTLSVGPPEGTLGTEAGASVSSPASAILAEVKPAPAPAAASSTPVLVPAVPIHAEKPIRKRAWIWGVVAGVLVVGVAVGVGVGIGVQPHAPGANNAVRF